MKLKVYEYKIPLRHVFRLAFSEKTHARTLVVEIEHNGIKGYGEAPESQYYEAQTDKIREEILAFRPYLEKLQPESPEKISEKLPYSKYNTFTCNAIDQALWDLWGRINSKNLISLWDIDSSHYPLSSYTIGIDTAENMIAKMKEFEDWPIFKVKLGRGGDIALVEKLRANTKAVFRVDVNGGWNEIQTITYSHDLKRLGVEFIEQPMEAKDSFEAKDLKRKSVLPIFADESCRFISDVNSCAKRFHGINIKLVKCGGITNALEMIKIARHLGLKVMAGCMVESTVGISALAQIAPLVDYIDMDGALLLADDTASGVKISKGKAILPSRHGTGVELIESKSLVASYYE